MPVKRRGGYTSMTLAELRERGCLVEKVEKFNAYAGPHGQREDAFGFIDLIVIDPGRGIVGVQCTGPNGHAEHRQKILANEFAPAWLRAGGKIELWSWRKLLVQRGGQGPPVDTTHQGDHIDGVRRRERAGPRFKTTTSKKTLNLKRVIQ